MESEMIIFGILAGIAATETMDVLGIASGRVGLTAGARGIWVGRWYPGMLRGRFAHEDITSSPALKGERRAALAGHYIIGVVLAVLYLAGADGLGYPAGALAAAVGYGLATVVFSWLLVLSCLGFGVLGLKGPPELKLVRSSLANHLAYGIGLWWSVSFLRTG